MATELHLAGLPCGIVPINENVKHDFCYDLLFLSWQFSRQERFAEMFGAENTSKLIPSPTQVRYHSLHDISNGDVECNGDEFDNDTGDDDDVAGRDTKDESWGLSAGWQRQSQLYLSRVHIVMLLIILEPHVWKRKCFNVQFWNRASKAEYWDCVSLGVNCYNFLNDINFDSTQC